MDKPDLDSDEDSMAFEPPDPDDVQAIVAFYERTGVMPLRSIGPPVDRQIIPSRRPERVGDFDFTTGADEAPAAPSATEEAENPKARKILRDFDDMLKEALKDL